MSKTLQHIDPGLKEIYESLVSEFTIVCLKWQTAKDLFGHSQERVDLLNRTATDFFHICQTTFRDEVFIGLSRLTDPLQSAGKDNLCLQRLYEQLHPDDLPKFFPNFGERISEAQRLCEPFRTYRHKKLAHLDLSVALSSPSESLPQITIGQIDEAVTAVGDALNSFGQYFFDITTYFQMISQRAGVRSLTYYLERGEQAVQEEQRRKLEGIN
jgi:hypothetical protein